MFARRSETTKDPEDIAVPAKYINSLFGMPASEDSESDLSDNTEVVNIIGSLNASDSLTRIHLCNFLS